MKKIKLFTLSFLISSAISAQNYFEEFQKHQRNEDTLKQRELLNTWERKDPNNAELYTSKFNYYFNMSMNEVIMLTDEAPKTDEEYITISDSTNNVAGYMTSQMDYEKTNIDLAFESINKGIKLHPNRLDMRFGKIYVLGKTKDWRGFTDELVTTITYSAENNNEWTWTLNKAKENGKEFFLGSIQDYQMQLYNTMDDNLLDNMQEIAEAVLKYYPGHIESLANSAITHIVKKEYEKALKPLKKAEEINDKDFIVLNNIAFCYKELKQKEKAIEYYNKVIKYGDARGIEQANSEIKKLQ